MGDNCCGQGHCHDKEDKETKDDCCEEGHDDCGCNNHDHSAFAVDQLAMTNNVLVNTLIDILIQKGVFKEEEFEVKLKEQGVEGYSEEEAEEKEESDSEK